MTHRQRPTIWHRKTSELRCGAKSQAGLHQDQNLATFPSTGQQVVSGKQVEQRDTADFSWVQAAREKEGIGQGCGRESLSREDKWGWGAAHCWRCLGHFLSWIYSELRQHYTNDSWRLWWFKGRKGTGELVPFGKLCWRGFTWPETLWVHEIQMQ